MRRRRMGYALALALALAAPVTAEAQVRPGLRTTADLFAGMSADGRRIMTQALMTGREAGVADQMRAAHEEVLTLLAQPVLDRAALEKAMQAEDRLMIAQAQRRTDALLKAFLQLSAADRQAWVANQRAIRARQPARPAPMP